MALTTEELAAIAEARLNNRQAEQNIAAAEEAIANAEQNIVNARADISLATSQLLDPDLPQDRRVFYEANIAADLRVIASNENTIQTQQDSIAANNEVIAINQNIINNVESGATATNNAAPVPPSQAGPIGVAYDDDGNLLPGYTLDENNNPVFVGGGFVEPATAASAAGSKTAAAANKAKQQSTLQTRVNQPAAADWRVRLRLAPNADYLYKIPAGNDPNSGPGILAPLAATDGVVFPYTPVIETSYQAKYDSYDLTHSNYRGYFYKNSTVENITIKGTFTAQDTREEQYLLAVIHFFKSVTKMFYGQDQQAGTPPPLVYLSGFGKYQFNENPCVVTTFGYSLPNDVDYIRANGFNNIGLNMENRRSQSSGPAIGGSLGTVVAILDRLTNAGLGNGSLTNKPSPSQVNQNVANQTSINSTYVPTKMEISITLLPMQTRNQVSKQFSLKSFANGSLLAGGGFW
jgi:hypothetical protein